MNRQPDRFFRDKLDGYQPPVSAEVWSRVAANVSGQTTRHPWLRFAAGFVLLASAGILIFTLEKSDSPPLAVKETPDNKKTESANNQESITEQKQPAGTQDVAIASTDIVEGKSKNTTKSTGSEGRRQTAEKKIIQNSDVTISQAVPQLAEKTEGNELLAASNAVSQLENPERKNVTLVFTVQEVNEKYLRKKDAVADATSEEKETSTWRKVLDKAHDLKHNQDPLGDLRQKKNEILALNFKTDQQSHENQ